MAQRSVVHAPSSAAAQSSCPRHDKNSWPRSHPPSLQRPLNPRQLPQVPRSYSWNRSAQCRALLPRRPLFIQAPHPRFNNRRILRLFLLEQRGIDRLRTVSPLRPISGS